MNLWMYIVPLVVVVAFVVITASVKILRQYERAVVFTLGRFQGVKGPGLVLLIPFFQEMVRVDLRIQVIEIPTQDVISRDNVSMKVDAVLYFNVVDPERAIISVQRYLPATVMLAQTTLRAVLGQHELDEMLSERKKLSADVQSILDSQTETWGIKVTNVEIRTVELTENMVRAIAKQAEAERDRRAKIIHAEAEFQASQTLVNAAQILGSIPAAMQLRYLQTLTEIGAEQNSTIVFPMPIDIIKPFLELFDKSGKPAGAATNGAAHAPLITAAAPQSDICGRARGNQHGEPTFDCRKDRSRPARAAVPERSARLRQPDAEGWLLAERIRLWVRLPDDGRLRLRYPRNGGVAATRTGYRDVRPGYDVRMTNSRPPASSIRRARRSMPIGRRICRTMAPAGPTVDRNSAPHPRNT